MLIDFFYSLRAARLPVSVKELLTLLECLQANVVGPRAEACSLDDFYFLARTVLVKDEKHFDRFDRAFGAYPERGRGSCLQRGVGKFFSWAIVPPATDDL